MYNNDFAHLHVHTEYSLLDGANHIDKLINKVKEFGMKNIAITDHGTMYGAVEFYKKAVKEGIKPIIGCEVYVAKRRMENKEANIDDQQYHLILLAKNNTGYKNLLKITTEAFIKGFYYKPRIDYALLEKHSEGLICLSACIAGEIPSLIKNGNYSKAFELALKYQELFGKDHFYIELQDHRLDEQKEINHQLIKLSKETNIPLVATNDVHYLEKKDSISHDILLCIQTAKKVDDNDRLKFPSDEFYLKNSQEMKELFKDSKEAIENTIKIAEMCDIELDFENLHLPEYKTPKGYNEDKYLEKLCYDGLKARYNNITKEIEDRLNHELLIIKKMRYSSYFLIVWDFVKYALEKGIIVGPGRGSAAGSIVAYCLNITNIDPIKYNLLFERFLNPERISMPDIDIDFCYERRQEVIDYVSDKYGSDRVSQIITFGTMAARAAIRDVGRAYNFPYNEVDKIAKMVPFDLGITLEKALEINPELKKTYNENEKVKKLLDTSRALEGLPRHASTHAAGVVISKEALTEYVPLQRISDGNITTQYAMNNLEELGLLKMDFLGLRTLTVIRDTIDIIKDLYGETIDITRIPESDKKVFDLLSKGNTAGVFQLESTGMKSLLKELKPNTFDDIAAVIGLYRPGPLGSGAAEDFIQSKHGKKPIKYLHPKLEPILKETYGVILYQEQAMRIAQELAGFTLAQADILRKAMGKKKTDVMESQKQRFIKGCNNKGISINIAEKIFEMIAYFAGYGFNKSHTAAYALIAYQTAYLKAHYTVEFMAALLTSVMDNTDKVSEYIDECKKMDIKVLPPDVNESLTNFTVVAGKIRFGLAAVKNVGKGAIKSIISARNQGSFTSLNDFCHKVSSREITKKTVESLIKCGAFDFTKAFRSQLLAIYQEVIDSVHAEKKNNLDGQITLFGMLDNEETKRFNSDNFPKINEFNKRELLTMEKETLGFYISGHPLMEFEHEISEIATVDSKSLNKGNSKYKDGSNVVFVGIIVKIDKKTTKNDKVMAFMVLEDLKGEAEVVVFPDRYEKYLDLLYKENIVIISGRINYNEEEIGKIICDEISPIEKLSINKNIFIRIFENDKKEKIDKIYKSIKKYPGNVPVYFYINGEDNCIKAKKDLWVKLNKNLLDELKKIAGEENIEAIDTDVI